MNMKAAVLYEQRKPLVVDDIEIQDPKDGEVMVKMAAAGICHSDLHFMEGLWPAPVPMVMGHEGAGIVEKVGPGVTSVAPGDHVVTSWVSPCGTCMTCMMSKPWLCVSALMGGGTMRDGTTRLKKGNQQLNHQNQVSTFAEYAVLPASGAVKIRDDMPLDKAALLGCGVMTGFGAVFNTAKVTPGSSVVVYGCGGVGLNVIQAAALANATTIIAVDTLDNKLEMAKQFGATHVINSSQEDPVPQVQAITGTMGAAFGFEVVGKPSVITQTFESVRPTGIAVVVGMAPAASNVVISTIGLFLTKTLTGSFYGEARIHQDMPMLADLYMAGKLKLDELVSRVYPLARINDAFDALKKGEVARSIIKFD